MRLLELLFGPLESLGRLDLFTVGTCAEGLNADVDAYRLGLANACRRYGFGEAVLVENGSPVVAGVSGFLCLGRLFQGQPNEAALCI